MTNPTPPMKLGDRLDSSEFRAAASKLLNHRQECVRAYEKQARDTAKANAEYESVKSTRYLELKNKGGADDGVISAAEAGERVKGDGAVQIALIKRDTGVELVRARREDIAGVDEALSTLRLIAKWSLSQEERGV